MDPITAQALLGAAGAGDDPVYVDDVFSTYLYDGTGSALTITNGIDLSGEGGLVWTKRRNSSRSNILFDSERGAASRLVTDNSFAESNQPYSITMNSDGYAWSTTDNDINVAGSEYVSWTFRKSPGFFDCVTWVGSGTGNRTVSHALESTPGLIIIKDRTDSDNDWLVYHANANGDIFLNKNDAQRYQASTTRNVPSAPFNTIEVNRRNGYLLVADTANSGGTAQYVYYSQDGGQSWTARQLFTGSGADCHKIHWAYDYFYFSGFDNGGSGQYHLKYSQDGHNWYNAISTSTGTSFDYVQYARNIGSGTYVVSAQTHSYYWTSTNGTSWTQRNYPSGVSGMHIQCSEDACVAVLRGTTNVYYYSTDAINWTQANSPFGNVFHTLAGSNGDKDGKGAVIVMAHYSGGPYHTFNGVNWYGSGSFSNGQRSWGEKVHYSNGHYYHYDGQGTLRQSRLGYGTGGTTSLGSGSTYGDFYADEDHYALRGTTSNTTLSLYPTPKSITNVGSTYFSVPVQQNKKNNEYVAYVFANNEQIYGTDGDESIIKCGSYTGNGTSGSSVNTINLGFEPQWVMIKKTSSTGNWLMLDTMRGYTIVGDVDEYMYANSSTQAAEHQYGGPTATGFQVEGTDGDANGNGASYTYIAIRRPNKPPETGTDAFNVVARTGTNASITASSGNNRVTDMVITKARNSGNNHVIGSRLLGRKTLAPDSDNDDNNNFWNDKIFWDKMSGVGYANYDQVNASSRNYLDLFFTRAEKFFDVVTFGSPSGGSQTLSHSLTVPPEMIWVKNRDSSYDWQVYHQALGTSSWLHLNRNLAASTSNSPGFANIGATTFDVGNYVAVAGSRNVAYLFATLPGVSKVGSYTGSNSDLNIDCGFTNGARFVLIKRTTAASDWWYVDTARGINSGNDPALQMNSSGSESSSYDLVDSYSAGFTAVSGTAAINISGHTYIYLAIA